MIVKRCLLLIVIATVTIGCGGPAAQSTLPWKEVPVPVGSWGGLAWLGTQNLLIEKVHLLEATGSLWNLTVAGGQIKPVVTPVAGHCTRVEFTAFDRYIATQATVSSICISPAGFGNSVIAVAVDGATHTVIPRLANGMGTAFNVATLSWSPDRNSAVGSYESSLCGTIFAADASGAHPVHVTVGDGSAQWSLGDDFMHPDANNCGLATSPAWSPTGNAIAFLADPKGRIPPTQNRTATSVSLYIAPSPSSHAAIILAGLQYAGALVWSPSGHALAFIGQVNGSKGTWILDPSSGQVRKILEMEPNTLAWSPDGRSLAFSFTKSQGATPASEIDGFGLVDVSQLGVG